MFIWIRIAIKLLLYKQDKYKYNIKSMAIKFEGDLTLDHNWGDINGDGQYAATGYQIQNLVRSELKGRVGYFYSFSKNNIQNILIGFANQSKYEDWFNEWKDADTGTLNPERIDAALAEGLANGQVLCSTEVAKGIPDPFYSAKLDNKYSSSRYISVDGKISIPVRFTSTYNQYDATTGELQVSDLGEQGTLIVQARQDSSISWDSTSGISKTEQKIIPTGYDKSDSDEGSIQYVDLTNFLSNGSWEVRMMVKNNTADGTESAWINFSVIKTVINVSLRTSWAEAQTTGKLVLDFDYSGAFVDKYLNIEVTGVGATTTGGQDSKVVVTQLGTNASGVANIEISTQSNDTYRVNEHGIHTIKYWVNIEQNSAYETSPKYAQIMMATDPNNLNPYIILNDIKGDSENNLLTNWANENILSYAVYAPTEQGDLYTNFPVKLSFKDNTGKEYFNDIYTINSKTGEIRTVNKDLAIESDNDIIAPRLYCESNFDNLEKQYNLLVTKSFMQFYVNNVGDYAPSTGAKFIFNPRTRSNSESETERIKIYNSATGQVIGEATGGILDENAIVKWEGVNFNNTDGWIQDSAGSKCLRLLDGQQLTIPYQPFSNEGSSAINCYTVELTVATRNIVDNTIPLIRICDEYGSNENGEPMINGFELRGNDAYFIPNKERSRSVLDIYDVLFQEGVKTHIALNICHYVKRNKEVIYGDIKTLPTDAEPKSVELTQDYHFIRIYVNGVLNRVAEYTGNPMSDELHSSGSGSGALKRYIVFGNTGVMDAEGKKKAAADLDIYEMRIYKGTYEKPEDEILKDYIASLSSIEEKQVIMDANNILDETTGRISYNKASLKYNTLIWRPGSNSNQNYVRPCGQEFGDTGKKSNKFNIGDLEVRLFKTNSQGKRVLDEEKSGVINALFAEGQGTSAMSYWKWNQRYKLGEFDDVTTYFTPFNSEYAKIKKGYPLNDDDPVIARLDGKINWASSMQSHKMGTTALYNDCQKEVVGGNSLCFLNSVDAFNKVDLKKTGAKITIKNDDGSESKVVPTAQQAFDNACKFTGRSNAYGSCRTCVRQEPFLFFVQPEYKKDADGNPTSDLVDPIYYGPLTWGASKGDKPTFGYNKEFNKYFVMIEGTDNDRELIMCRVPWDNTHVVQYFEAEEDGQAESDWVVCGIGEGKAGNYYGDACQFEISMGKDTKEYIGEGWDGSNPCLQMFKDMINFAYLHNPHINAFEGTYSQLKESTGLKTTEFYWVTQGSNTTPDMAESGTKSEMYDLYRYNSHPLDGEAAWVPAGFYNAETKTYAKLNLQTQLQLKSTELIGTAEENNIVFKNARVARFKSGYKTIANHPYGYTTEYPNGISDYVNVKDLQFTLQFLKLVAGTDNWGKNTYFYNSGVYYTKDANGNYYGGSEKYDGLEKFGFFQDDMDTIFEIDNSGQKTKPYYVEEHDIEKDDGTTIDYYWNSQTNALFCSAEQAYENEMKSTMSDIFESMKKLGGDPVTCFDKYYQLKTAQDYPAIVFNQNANLMYMDGHYRGVSSGTKALFLSQCLGDQVQAEREWQKQRVQYMSSYARWGEFNPGTSSDGGMIMRSKGYAFIFELTPHIWLYPAITHGSSDIYYTGTDKNPYGTKGRVKAGETISLQTKADSETQVNLKSINSYRDIGNFARHTADTQFTLKGSRITDFVVRGTRENPILFNPSGSFIIDAAAQIDNLRNFEVTGQVAGNAQIMKYELNLQRLWRLETLDLTATATPSVILPDNSNIKSIKLPNTITNLKLVGQKKLNTFELGGYQKLINLEISDTPFIDTLQFMEKCREVNAPINSLTLQNINWEKVTIPTLKYILGVNNTNVTGKIYMNPTNEIDFDTKAKLLNKFGNIDNIDNSLYINYTEVQMGVSSTKIVGDTYLSRNGRYQYTLVADGNNFKSIEWLMDPNEFATIDNSGLLTYVDKPEIIDNLQRTVKVKCSILLNSGTVITKEKVIYFYEKAAEIGDYVYFDGTLSTAEEYNPSRTVIGVCYYVNGDDRRMMAVNLASPEPCMWGLSSAVFGDLNSEYTQISPTTIGVGSMNQTGGHKELTSAKVTTKATTTPLTTYAYSANGIAAGFPQIPTGTELGCGQYNTINIIEHRNEKIVNSPVRVGVTVIPGCNEIGEYLKPEKDHLTELINNAKNLGKLQIESSIYPAASYCYAYEPTVKEGETLNDKFKIHNWYLPSASEMLYMWRCSGPTKKSNGDANPYGYGYCENLKKYGVWVEPAEWSSSSGPSYWSSNQNSTAFAIRAIFRIDDMRVYTTDMTNGDTTTSGQTNKIQRYYVRACARF